MPTAPEGHPLRLSIQARRFILRAWLFVMFLAAMPAIAQTVRPVIDENVVKGPGKKASGRIEYVNDSLETLNVALDSRSFTVSDIGELSYEPLDSHIHVKFSTISFRIPPKQSFFVFYEAWADSIPSWFVVYATFSGFNARTREGLQLQVLLPHTIYLLPKQGLRKNELQVKVAEYRPEDKKVVVRVANTGRSFGRVLEATVTSGKGKTASNGFPVFPRCEREVEIPWDTPGPPSKLVLRLERFRLERDIAARGF